MFDFGGTVSEPKEIYNNGALKIIHNPIKTVDFGLYFNCGGVKFNMFLTREQVQKMYDSLEDINAPLAQLDRASAFKLNRSLRVED